MTGALPVRYHREMARGRSSSVAVALVIGCGGGSAGPEAWSPDTSGEGASGSGDTAGVPGDGTVADGVATSSDDPSAATTSSVDASSTGEPLDCTPWASTWIGAPCLDDGECTYDGGVCLREDQGFPCGTCSLPCEDLCPDQDGAPGTFCVDAADVGLEAGGTCLSRCDPELLGGNGCRDGYGCAALSRHLDPGTSTGVCVPAGMFSPMTACQQTLVDRGVAFVPTTHELDHPDGHPELDCEIIDPVLLYSPVLDITLREGDDAHPVLVACETAIAIADSLEIAAQMEPIGAVEVLHYGTYNCRVIAGTSTLSNHAEGRAIDLAGFVLADGQTLSVVADWEDGVASPVTAEGQWLRAFTDALWDTMTWHIILTPEYNADHDDHVHVDLTPGEMFYE